MPLRRAYEIISSELKGASEELTLQMAVKAVNNSAGPDGLVPTWVVVTSKLLCVTNNSTNNYKSLILFNYRFSLINSLSTYYFISVNLYIRKNLRLNFNSKLIT